MDPFSQTGLRKQKTLCRTSLSWTVQYIGLLLNCDYLMLCTPALLYKIAPYWFTLKLLLQQHVMLYHHKLFHSVMSALLSDLDLG